LVVSGCESPQTRSTSGRRLHELNDEGMVQTLRELNGTSVEVLQNRELIELLLPALRADFEMVDNYRFVTGPLLTSPIIALAGLSDTQVGTGGVEGWGALTQSTFAMHWIEGDHFFIDSKRPSVLDVLRPLVT
jgi:surfactin synthase thioesterase subunit